MKKRLVFFLIAWIGLFAQAADSSFKFALVTDTHVGNPNNNEDLYRTVKDINSLPDIAFVIVSGDVTEFGSDEELKTAKELLSDLNKPFYVIPGNHDSNWSESGTNSFKLIFGAETFGFEHNGYKFIGLASGPNMRMGRANSARKPYLVFRRTQENRQKHPNHLCEPLSDGSFTEQLVRSIGCPTILQRKADALWTRSCQ